MPSPMRGPADPTLPKPADGRSASREPWRDAFKTLDAEQQKRFDQNDADLIGILEAVSRVPL